MHQPRRKSAGLGVVRVGRAGQHDWLLHFKYLTNIAREHEGRYSITIRHITQQEKAQRQHQRVNGTKQLEKNNQGTSGRRKTTRGLSAKAAYDQQ